MINRRRADIGSPASPNTDPASTPSAMKSHEWRSMWATTAHDHLISPEERFKLAMARQ